MSEYKYTKVKDSVQDWKGASCSWKWLHIFGYSMVLTIYRSFAGLSILEGLWKNPSGEAQPQLRSIWCRWMCMVLPAAAAEDCLGLGCTDVTDSPHRQITTLPLSALYSQPTSRPGVHRRRRISIRSSSQTRIRSRMRRGHVGE